MAVAAPLPAGVEVAGGVSEVVDAVGGETRVVGDVGATGPSESATMRTWLTRMSVELKQFADVTGGTSATSSVKMMSAH